MDTQTKKFTRKKEDFVCEHCKAEVKGSGYTNHCPVCLWSKHVDINPGDRAALCLGMMKPKKIEGPTDKFMIVHECIVCGYTKRNRMESNDSYDAAAAIVKSSIR
jgi:rubrerythrin